MLRHELGNGNVLCVQHLHVDPARDKHFRQPFEQKVILVGIHWDQELAAELIRV